MIFSDLKSNEHLLNFTVLCDKKNNDIMPIFNVRKKMDVSELKIHFFYTITNIIRSDKVENKM